ncbi:hypothetical protein AAA799E16_00695 [Marine Group I thaumarchaeote SCGC AAA799-E16]|uniref:Uncharacterized protein n=5 Tax=Marine Group I TaxID=905826 RepID=A0A087S6P5_9ARCH|nr:hypothetical protein AAA799N04_00862 [Marine Group I thaumarchaeote SCGC AAA799-N04]KER06636.1 hypothetical protein AAA799E16_00695 [Marine Group I thaumarchaeote SCGC AAA799-E16]KFM16051.1 hypothetical protein AAA799D11_00850 [Marine Group I thaumarchaeote SCGC AAA799-D11]KFM17788.1 hypothetical protein SCCGRSA3_01728 [Marine Group I thaumarchaeote SCGC RSA3]KFM21399.1 hypothetical protein AAA799B03_01069 [Marine Group I thaumarchaeote SCGC AAA799-B03]
MAVLGRMELSSGQKGGLAFGGALVVAGLVLSTLVFPFWNLIREDISEEVKILSNDDGMCYVETSDNIPKIIEDCTLEPGDVVTITYGEGLAWATITEP